MNLHEKLSFLDSALDHNKLLNFKFSADRKHDYNLIDWFCKNGELRINKNSIGSFSINLVSKNLKIHIGYVYSGCTVRNENKKANWQNEYTRRAWNKLKKFQYCTNNLLFTPDEVVGRFHGKKEYMFSNSKETKLSIVRNTKKVTDILNSLTPINLD